MTATPSPAMDDRRERSLLRQLTLRELEILGLIACGDSTQAIADALLSGR